jgi:hypothetical protein
MLKVLEGLPAKMGFRMPAEWEPHEQCWMGWPVRTRSPTPCFSLSDSPLIFVLLLPFMFFVLSFWGRGSVLRGCSCSHPCLVL